MGGCDGLGEQFEGKHGGLGKMKWVWGTGVREGAGLKEATLREDVIGQGGSMRDVMGEGGVL